MSDVHYVTQEQLQGELIRIDRRISGVEDRMNTRFDSTDKDFVKVKASMALLESHFNDELDSRIRAKDFKNKLMIAVISAGSGGLVSFIVAYLSTLFG